MNNFEIAPSILSADFGFLTDEIKKVENDCNFIHIDVMDGHYVPNLSLGIPVIKSIRKYTDKIFDVHLMISNPEKYLEAFAKAGSDYITFHIECSDNPIELINQIHGLGKKAGVAIHPDTPIDKVYPYLEAADLVLVMTVRPGFGGQGFLEGSEERISAVRDEIARINTDIILAIDGGVNIDTIKSAKDAGAEFFVAGSAVFGKENPGQAIRDLLTCISQ